LNELLGHIAEVLVGRTDYGFHTLYVLLADFFSQIIQKAWNRFPRGRGWFSADVFCWNRKETYFASA